MKRLPFRKVKILKRTKEVDYVENLCSSYTKYRDSNSLWCYEKKRIIWEKCDNQKYVEKYKRCCEKYHRSLKKPGRKLALDNSKWLVLDSTTNEVLAELDSIEQAKRFCIKNDYDFGMYDK